MAEQQIVILGGRGMLGSELVRLCQQKGLAVKAFDLPEFDITAKSQVKRAIGDCRVIVNCAAYTNVEKAESESKAAYAVNAAAVALLGELAEKINAWVLHISTDFVFDGTNERPYVETDLPNPLNVYGKSKLAGEQLLVASGCRHCIIRVEWTYGPGGSNFVAKLVSQAKQGKPLKVVDDQIGSPTSVTEVAAAICSLLKKEPQGLFHFAADGYVSRFDMATFIFEKLGMSINMTPCKTDDFPSAATRPLNSCFDCGKIRPLLDEPIKPWQEPLELFVRQL